MASTLVKPTQELRKMVERVIKKYHADLEDGVVVEPVFVEKACGDGGLGKLSIFSGLAAYPYFLGLGKEDAADLANTNSLVFVEVPRDVWTIYKEPAQREALIDHLLCYAERDGETGKIDKCKPDLYEFNEVAQRHGKWHTSLKDFFLACQGKLKFPDPEPQAEPAEASGEEGAKTSGRRRAAEAGAEAAP
jgi:hypothetical protein